MQKQQNKNPNQKHETTLIATLSIIISDKKWYIKSSAKYTACNGSWILSYKIHPLGPKGYFENHTRLSIEKKEIVFFSNFKTTFEKACMIFYTWKDWLSICCILTIWQMKVMKLVSKKTLTLWTKQYNSQMY